LVDLVGEWLFGGCHGVVLGGYFYGGYDFWYAVGVGECFD